MQKKNDGLSGAGASPTHRSTTDIDALLTEC
jgi:hypothetical protein